MKRLLVALMISALFALFATLGSSLIVAMAQQVPPAPNPPTQQEPAPIRLYEGELIRVDAVAKTIAVKGPNDSQMLFAYNDETQIVGLDDGTQGLTGSAGSSLKVSYREERGMNRATKIEIVTKK